MTTTTVDVGSPAVPAKTATDTPPGRSRGLVLGIVLVGQFMAILDVSIVNVAAATIRRDLHASGAALQMVIAGYTIAYAMLLITGARLGGLHGARRVFLAGLLLFTAASLACGLAGSSGVLIAFRLAQGTGAALMVPQVLNIIQLNFAGEARARALSAYAAVIAGGIVAGQVVGGVLVDADLFGTAWRPVFLVNVPLGVTLLVLGRRLLPVDAGRRDRQLDLAGLVTLSAAVVMVIVPLVLGHELGWPAWGWALLAGSAVMLGAFVLIERSIARRGGSPLIPAAVVRAPTMAVAALAIFVAMGTFGGFLFSMALHLQTGLGDSPLRAGLTFVPAALGFATGSLTWQRLPVGWHRRQIPLGFAVAALAYGVVGLLLRSGGHGAAGGVALAVAFAVNGLGFGYAYSPILSTVLRHVAPEHAPDASGLLVTTVQLGQVVGVATFGTLFLSLVDPAAAAGPTAHAIAVTSAALAAACAVAALLGLRMLATAR
ncbi:MAG TPA: MFS transporter [Acidimicrobiales bacterium]|jgi:MFS family permease|nr:MFS transporter [Acidimicrobiales bacterium]